MDLKSKLDVDGHDDPSGVIGALRADEGAVGETPDPRRDVRVALGELGYTPDEVKAVLRRLQPDGDAAALLREALALLART